MCADELANKITQVTKGGWYQRLHVHLSILCNLFQFFTLHIVDMFFPALTLVIVKKSTSDVEKFVYWLVCTVLIFF